MKNKERQEFVQRMAYRVLREKNVSIPAILRSARYAVRRTLTILILLFLLVTDNKISSPAWAQNEKKSRKVEVAIVETDLQFVEEDQHTERGMQSPPVPDSLDKALSRAKETRYAAHGNQDETSEIEIEQEQIIQVNQLLKKAIEENRELKENYKKVDSQLRQIRGQRAIEANRMNTMRIERDAYKSKSEEVLRLKKSVEQDVDHFKQEHEQKVKTLESKIADLESQVINKKQRVQDTPLVQEMQRQIQSYEQQLQKEYQDSRNQQVIMEKDTVKELSDQIRRLETQLRQAQDRNSTQNNARVAEFKNEITRLQEKLLEEKERSITLESDKVKDLKLQIHSLQEQLVQASLQKNRQNSLESEEGVELKANLAVLQKRLERAQKVQSLIKAETQSEIIKLTEKLKIEEESQKNRESQHGLMVKQLKSQINALEDQLDEERDKAKQIHLTRQRQKEERQKEIRNTQDKSIDVMEMVAFIGEENQKLKAEEARIHYNMGNIFFSQGSYRRAREEYEKALVLAPSDPNVHFNLAFVNGEYLMDLKPALRHYSEYLQLNPEAEDIGLVQEKILELELLFRAQIPSRLEGDLMRYHQSKHEY